jgi:pimeloyl-ACP methyl ester carboxylesterase
MSVFDFPQEFRSRDVPTNGTSIHVRAGGTGPAVVLLHGYGETGDMWAPLASELARDHTVVVPDLRGLGLSSKPAGGFDKKTQAGDVAGVLDALKIDRADLVTHDTGNMVGYAFAAQYPSRVTRFVLIDAPLPGVGPWEDILKSCSGTFVSGGRIWSGWWRAASASISTASGTSFQRTLRDSAKWRAPITPSSTRCQAPCIPASCSSLPSTRTLSTINNPGQGQACDAGAGNRGRKVVWHDHGKDHAICGQQRPRGCHSGLGSLDHGGKPDRNNLRGASLPR